MKLFETLTRTFNTNFDKLSSLKSELASLNKEIQVLELRATIYSERDWLVVEECDAKLRVLNAKYLDLDNKILLLERDTVNKSTDFVCPVGTSVNKVA